ncbi:cytochrome c oxidase subunit 3 family protein [Mycolicibacterium psychrotolerans]|uniref:Probable cytochrome c oxidase subunit 3 n=1 Tax=Mycolicibacterium psychrotolerans TaxID=216929 RepID=A0A7I7MAC9_9MYCO|nr:cytochrome c oxidase subunit 3 family protein [Mycolicibacterium psychrotolerans]BBX69211.1 cytochrome c oxidase subunit III [Mycolicibacterium psychrotolerans]
MTETTAPRSDAPKTAARRGHLPGDLPMWVMVLGDLLIFGAYFLIFMVHRAMDPHGFLEAQQHLDLDIGALNTLVLLTSSWFIARSVVHARGGEHAAALRLTVLAGGCGFVFVALKGYEWSTMIAVGHTVAGSEFFMFYYMLTGVHVFHVLLGLVIMGVVLREIRPTHRRRLSMIESGAVYWHMVDLLWVVIFALLYVVR